MEPVYFNLSEEEYSKGRKILLWIVTFMFIIGGIYVVMLSPVFGKHNIRPVLSLAPFGIGLVIGAVALFASIKRKNFYFLINDEVIEFRYGLLKTVKKSFKWTDIRQLVIPHKEKKARLMMSGPLSYTIDLRYLQRKKASLIRKHLFQAAREKQVEVLKVTTLH
ncbi:MAG: hypothetical protein JXR66_10585 [Bacteroidales bacterium]|nr:hypothetical protein [Bacteroidales bacterium]MBN2633995.1 hypothetical protein [Bacteroidales bacterium]